MRIKGFADPDNAGWGGPRMGWPTWQNFGNALGVWVVAQDRRVTVRDAATAFNVDVCLILEALDDHPWLENVDGEAIGRADEEAIGYAGSAFDEFIGGEWTKQHLPKRRG